MTYPMPPELLEQLGLEPCAGTDPPWPEDHDALGWGRRAVIDREVELPERCDRATFEEAGELNVPALTPSTHAQVEWQEQLAQVRRLPTRQQRVLWMQAVGLSRREIAAETGWTLRTVERQTLRGRSRLRAAS